MQPEALQQLIQSKLPECEIRVESDGYHFTVTAISEVFAGLTPVKKQQLIYGCINDLIADGSVHAVNIKTYTPEQWRAIGG